MSHPTPSLSLSRARACALSLSLSLCALRLASPHPNPGPNPNPNQVGDVLLSVQGKPCRTPEQTAGLLRAAHGDVRVTVHRPRAAVA